MRQLNISQFLPQIVEQIANCPFIIGLSGLDRQHGIAQEYDRRVSNLHVVAAALEFLGQCQMVLADLEENLDIPAFAINPDDFFSIQFYIGAQDSQPFVGPTIPDEDDSGVNQFSRIAIFTEFDKD